MSAIIDKRNVLNYPNMKSWLGAGTYGIVFGTYSDKNEPIAVKIARVTDSG